MMIIHVVVSYIKFKVTWHFIKKNNGVPILDTEYDYNAEISKQIELMKKENITI